MVITDRQRDILNKIVEEYINTAQPVSSQLLEKKYDFEICPASIRIEMQKLADGGYIYQPHTSAGRAPTDKGYRFFVDSLEFSDEAFNKVFDKIEKDIENSFKFLHSITEKLVESSSAFTFGYIPEEKLFLKDGFKETFSEPEFKEVEFVSSFLKTIDNFEKDIDRLFKEFPEESHVFIGRENPIPRSKDFSLVTAKVRFPKKEKGMVAILGPRRMAYQKNINLVNTLNKVLNRLLR